MEKVRDRWPISYPKVINLLGFWKPNTSKRTTRWLRKLAFHPYSRHYGKRIRWRWRWRRTWSSRLCALGFSHLIQTQSIVHEFWRQVLPYRIHRMRPSHLRILVKSNQTSFSSTSRVCLCFFTWGHRSLGWSVANDRIQWRKWRRRGRRLRTG